MQLFGQNWTRRELEARIGHLGQIGGIRRMTLTEGKEAGTELIQVRTGAGLSFDVVPANCRVEGREAEAKRGGPQLLAPGASVFFKLGLNIA